MSDRCVENLREFGVELTVSETIKEIINALHSDGKPLHKVVYDVQSGQFGFVFDDGRFKHLLQLGQEPSEEVKKLKILLEETFDQVKRLERESGAAIAQAVDSKKSAMKADAEKKEVLEKLRAKEKELAAEKKDRKKAEAVLQKKLEEEECARRRAEADAAEWKAQAARKGESEIEKAACERAERAEAKASELEAKFRNLIANNLRQVTELKEAKVALNVQVQVMQNENGKLLADIEDAKISNEALAGKRDHHLDKVKELTRAKTELQRDFEKQRKRGDEAERRSEELMIEAETAKSSLQAQIDELKQTKVTEVVEIATQTGDCRSTMRSAEEGLCREDYRRKMDACLQEKSDAIRDRNNFIVMLKQYDSIYGPLPDDVEARGKRKKPARNKCKEPDWTCTVCNSVTYGSKKTDRCFCCNAMRKSRGK